MKRKLQTLTLEQLTTLLNASMENIEISDLCDSRFSLEQLDLLILKRSQGIDISLVANPLISYEIMELLVDAMENGIDISELVNPLLDEAKINLLIEANIAGINISGLANPFISLDTLKTLIDLRTNGKDKECINIIDCSAIEVEQTIYLIENGKSTDRVREIYRENTIDKLLDYIGDKTINTEKVSTPSRAKIYKIYNQNKRGKKIK